jgi:hypothetical protein
MLLKQSSTAQPLLFQLIDTADHIAGKTGATPTVTLRKPGGSFASPAGAVTEIANGWYEVAGNATDTNTLGPLILHATASGADPTDVVFEIVAFDPQADIGSKTGFSLSATGLDAITATAPAGVASTFPEMLVQLWRRFFKKSTLTATQLKTYADDGTTVKTTQTVNDDGTTETQGTAA